MNSVVLSLDLFHPEKMQLEGARKSAYLRQVK